MHRAALPPHLLPQKMRRLHSVAQANGQRTVSIDDMIAQVPAFFAALSAERLVSLRLLGQGVRPAMGSASPDLEVLAAQMWRGGWFGSVLVRQFVCAGSIVVDRQHSSNIACFAMSAVRHACFAQQSKTCQLLSTCTNVCCLV